MAQAITEIEKQINARAMRVFKNLVEIGAVRTQSELALKLGMAAHIPKRIDKNLQTIQVYQITTLVQKFGVNANYLFGTSTEMYGFIIKQSKINQNG